MQTETPPSRPPRPRRLQFSLRTLLASVFYFAVLFGLIGSLLASRRYTAMALARLDWRHGMSVEPMWPPGTRLRAEARACCHEMDVELLADAAVMQRAARLLDDQGFRGSHGSESLWRWLSHHIETSLPGGAEIVVVEYEDHSREVAVQVVNAFLKAYGEVAQETAAERNKVFFERMRDRIDPSQWEVFQAYVPAGPFTQKDTLKVLQQASCGGRPVRLNWTILQIGLPLWFAVGLVWLGLARWRRRRSGAAVPRRSRHVGRRPDG